MDIQNMPQYSNPAFFNYGGQQPQQVQKFKSTLTPEEIEKLVKNTSQFSLAITQEERLRGICNHRTADGMGDALVYDEVTGTWKCEICGYTFRQVDPSMSADEIKETIYAVIDLLQTIKLMFIDIPTEASREYFQIIPLLEKIPGLFELAAKNLSKHETFGWNYRNQNLSAYSMFENLSNIFGGSQMGVQPMYQQPNPYMNAPQPAVGTPGFGQSNGFGFVGGAPQQPQPMYQPSQGGYAYAPGAVAPAVPTIPQITPQDNVVDAAGETTVQQSVKA